MRNLRFAFPLCVAALLVQLLAPVGAQRAMARASFDRMAAAAHCSAAGNTRDVDAPAPADLEETCCALCALTTHVPVLAPQAASLPAPPREAARAPRVESERTARAVLSPPARGPPLSC